MTLVLFILILSLLIFIHEFGHFIVAKKSGIKVEEFGFGLPPRIFGKKIGETIYSLNLLPIGGFVRLYGEDGDNDNKTTVSNNTAFYQKSIGVRFLVLIAGVTMNLLLGIACFSIIYIKLGIPTKTNQITVIDVIKNSPAELSGIVANDIIYQINALPITSTKEFIELTKALAGQEVELLVGNDDKTRMVVVTPRVGPPVGEGPLGVAITDMAMKHYPWYQMPYLVVREGMKEALSWSGNILGSLITMIVGLVTQGKVPSDIAGPIGIYQITGQAAKAGKLALIQFIGILSINLAVINILPIPAMDGGRVMFLGYEALTRRKVKVRTEALVNNIGMAILIGLMVLITINDIVRLI